MCVPDAIAPVGARSACWARFAARQRCAFPAGPRPMSDRDAIPIPRDGDAPLEAVAVTMPPWPDADEAFVVPGKWVPTV